MSLVRLNGNRTSVRKSERDDDIEENNRVEKETKEYLKGDKKMRRD